MLNPRLPFLAGGIAVLAVALTQSLGWSDAAGFLFGWLLLVASLTAQRVVPFARRRLSVEWLALTRHASRWAVVARMRRSDAA